MRFRRIPFKEAVALVSEFLDGIPPQETDFQAPQVEEPRTDLRRIDRIRRVFNEAEPL
jgi:hypothetical protein